MMKVDQSQAAPQRVFIRRIWSFQDCLCLLRVRLETHRVNDMTQVFNLRNQAITFSQLQLQPSLLQPNQDLAHVFQVVLVVSSCHENVVEIYSDVFKSLQ